MRTLLWSYLGWRRFPRDMSAFELRHIFSFSVADRRELRVRYPRRPRLILTTTLDLFTHRVERRTREKSRTSLTVPAGMCIDGAQKCAVAR